MELLILWAIALVVIVILNAKFWKLCPDGQSDEGKAKERGIEPVIKPTPIPKWHIVNYYFDWAVLIGLISLAVWLVCNAV